MLVIACALMSTSRTARKFLKIKIYYVLPKLNLCPDSWMTVVPLTTVTHSSSLARDQIAMEEALWTRIERLVEL